MHSLLLLVVLCSSAVLVNAGARPAASQEPGYTNHPEAATPTSGYFNHPAPRAFPSRSRYSHPGPNRGQYHPTRGGFRGQYFPHPFQILPPGPKQRERLTKLDRLYKRVHTISEQIAFFMEKAAALATAMSILEKKMNELVTIQLDAFVSTHNAQKATAREIEEAISSITKGLFELGNSVNSLTSLNQYNTQAVARAESMLAAQEALNIQQQKSLGSLDKRINNLKPTLSQLLDNKMTKVKFVVERDASRLKSITTRESRKQCEMGQVNFKLDKRRAKYPYQTKFMSRPVYIYGIRGFHFDGKALKGDPAHFGYGPPPREPESKGMTVHAYTSSTDLVLQLFDDSFGQTKFYTAAMSFYVCSTGPAATPNNYYYY